MKSIAVYPGTFDPITNGHTDLVKRAIKIFDKVLLAVAEKPPKKTLFSITERVKFVETVFAGEENAEVYACHKIVVNFQKENSENVIN